MLEKTVPIPFLGKNVSRWLYRTTRWTQEHPYKACATMVGVFAVAILYEAQVNRKNRVMSPNVNNHLEYTIKSNEPSRWWVSRWLRGNAAEKDEVLRVSVATDAAAPSSEANARAETLSEEDVKVIKASQMRMLQAEKFLQTTTDPAQRKALEDIIHKEKELMKGYNLTTMMVTSGQLMLREPHWQLRSNERNWSILSRDQQQQKDHYWYRADRGREDDYARNTYERN